MAFDEYVSEKTWSDRYNWLRGIEEAAVHPSASYLLSSQGTFITYDLEIAFCAGAWVSVIVLAHAAIDATLRDTETGNYKSNSKVTFGGNPELEWLRKKRNALVHVSDPNYNGFIQASDLHNIDLYHSSLEEDAKRAMKLVFRTIYDNPGT
jgi:hypothetical protein